MAEGANSLKRNADAPMEPRRLRPFYRPPTPFTFPCLQRFKLPVADTDPEPKKLGASPYSSETVYIYIGENRTQYAVPKGILETRAPSLPAVDDGWNGSEVKLPNVHEDVGHTLIHFIFTNEYQPWPGAAAAIPQDAKREFTQGVLTFSAAMEYKIDRLKDCAWHEITRHRNTLSVFDIASVFRTHWAILSNNGFLTGQLVAKVVDTFSSNNRIFQDERFIELFGGPPEFDKCLAKVMAILLTHKIDLLQEPQAQSTGSRRATSPAFEIFTDNGLPTPQSLESLSDEEDDRAREILQHEDQMPCCDETDEMENEDQESLTIIGSREGSADWEEDTRRSQEDSLEPISPSHF
ncbi:hypothetical protein BJX63DRAFT_434779 [Aspergillus granulosus]|uniref:Uncharacterized protein n=1 Tax=Aspergillus granulosus TaxID=176169 RepID=A0ABR4H503_9EURO